MAKPIKSTNENSMCANCSHLNIGKSTFGMKNIFWCNKQHWTFDRQYCEFDQLSCDDFKLIE